MKEFPIFSIAEKLLEKYFTQKKKKPPNNEPQPHKMLSQGGRESGSSHTSRWGQHVWVLAGKTPENAGFIKISWHLRSLFRSGPVFRTSLLASLAAFSAAFISRGKSIHMITLFIPWQFLIVHSPNPSVFAWPTLKIIPLSQRND